MPTEILTPDEMGRADALTMSRGFRSGPDLMAAAADAIVREALRRHAAAAGFDVLCGPGNNGGDGYAAATRLVEAGADVRLYAEGEPRGGSDAALAAAHCHLPRRALADLAPVPGRIVIDALFGAGLARPLDGAPARAAIVCAESGTPVIAVDLPSGLSGLTGEPLGPTFRAALTVTFARPKPGHLLLPGRSLCGELVVADIGIPASVIAEIASTSVLNEPALWLRALPRPAIDAHKYARGHAVVFSGGVASTGAARLAAAGAARAGAGAVTLLSPPAALAVNAAQLTAIMVRAVRGPDDAASFVADRRVASAVLGPGYGTRTDLAALVARLLVLRAGGAALSGGLVLDADAITVMARDPEASFATLRGGGGLAAVLTPHMGEFARLFPDIAADGTVSKLERTRQAARRSGAVVLLKGPDTVVADPSGRASIAVAGSPWLATAGSGDVLAGLIGGLAAQGMPLFEAASAAAWIHGETGRRFGPGLIADDLPAAVVPVLRELHGMAEATASG